MSFHTQFPSSELSPFIKKYWGMESCGNSNQFHTQRIIPSGMPELIFMFGDKPQILNDANRTYELCSLNGHLKGFYDLQTSGSWNLFSVLFKPQGLMHFFDIPAVELLDKNVSLRFLMGTVADELQEKMAMTNDFSQRVILIELFLKQLLFRKKENYHFRRLNDSVGQIIQSGGNIQVAKLSDQACLSRKQFERLFLEYLGNSPKQMMKTIRFQRAIHQKSVDPNLTLTQLAYHCGYYDQSHMISEFKQMSGITPLQFFSSGEVFSDLFG
jgi:AraC-like DNA-binding protein